MKTSILMAPTCTLQRLENIFIEMTAKNCNQRCKHCYIDFPITKNIKDFIEIEIVKRALEDIKDKHVQCIYLTGAEPMTHPDFNQILRLCLKYANTCICTNGSFINEKKARFLKKVQDEGSREIIFKLSLDHYDEQKNDAIRCRGSYRQTLSAIKNLIKYDFNPIITVTNFYNEDVDYLKNGIKQLLTGIGMQVDNRNICINNFYDKNNDSEMICQENNLSWLDCSNSRCLTTNGIYSCPFLANDHRGRCGSDFNDFSDKISLETSYCNTCLKNSRQVFGINLYDFDN